MALQKIVLVVLSQCYFFTSSLAADREFELCTAFKKTSVLPKTKQFLKSIVWISFVILEFSKTGFENIFVLATCWARTARLELAVRD